MSGRARARRICQAAIGALIDPKKAAYDLVKDETGDAFDRWFPDKTPEQRLLAAVLADIATAYPDNALTEHLAASAQALFAAHGLSRAELTGAGVRLDATKAADTVCRRGLTTKPRPSDKNPPPVEIDPAIETPLRHLVRDFYDRLIKNLDIDLQLAIFGRLIVDVGEVKADVEVVRRWVENQGEPSQVRPPPFSMKRPVDDFKGYEAEIATVKAALAYGSAAISAVQGIGGVGKTELARQVAWEMRTDFPDGQILVDMLGTTQPRTARDAMTDVLIALGAQAIDPNTLAATYQTRLAGKRLLILLDNVAGQAGLDQLLPPHPAALLVTSRTRLALPGVQPVQLTKLSRDAAKALVTGMVPALTTAQADTLAALCADLPLALRVAGAYLQTTGYAIDAYLEELMQRRLARLAESGEDIGDATLNPMVVLGHSYDRLAESNAALARLFTLLGISPADFEVAGAAAVLALDEPTTRRQLARLVQLGLVQPPEQSRWRLHDLLRELATAKGDADEKGAASARYQHHYLARLAWCSAETTGHGADYRFALETVERELVNMMAATRQAADRRDPKAAAPAQAGLGNVLSFLGRREDALAATEEAVDLYRRLADDRPDAFNPALAGSLNNLGVRLDALGRHEDALAATEEAVDLYRRLAEERPDAFNPDLAASLNNLGNRLDALGRHEDALAATEEAVAIRRRLAEDRPNAFNPDLARSLNNLGADLSALGRRGVALAATEEAVDLYRRLAEDRPNAFNPDLARSLNNLGNRVSALGRREEALAVTEEAVALYRCLAEDRPAAFNPYLAMSLCNLARRRDEMGETEAAVALDVEAIETLRGPFFDLPAAHRRMMRIYVRDYQARCQKLGIEPDAALLAPITDILARLKAEDAAR